MDNVGIIDLDFLETKKLCSYNFGVLLVSSYYLKRGRKVRLIIDLQYDNLKKYDKIYIFKDYKTRVFPANIIKNYYSLPIEEYGEGFPNKPLLPDLPELIYTPINTTIYQPIISYIRQGGKQFQIDENWPNKNYVPVKIFFEQDGELLLREEPKQKYLWIYDDPIVFFTTSIGRQKMTELLKKSIIIFIKPLRISVIPPDNYETIMLSGRIRHHKSRLYAIDGDPYLDDFINWCETHRIPGYTKMAIRAKQGILWLKQKGGRVYGNYRELRLNEDDDGGTNETFTKKDIPIRRQWFTTQRLDQGDRFDRERNWEEEKRRKYLPSERAKRYRQNKHRRGLGGLN